MADLKLKRKDVQLVINFPIHAPLTDLDVALSGMGYMYAYILHDKDTDSDGCYKTRHLHLVISSLKRHELKYYIRFICEVLGTNDNQVSILPCDSVPYSVQYLIHKNDPDKFQYNITSIKTNMNEGLLSDYLNEDVIAKLTTNDIIRLCVESRGDKIKIIEMLGIARYSLYRNTINDIYSSLGYRLDNYKYHN